MPGPGWYLIGREEEEELVDTVNSRVIGRYRFDDLGAASKTMRLESEMAGVLGARHVLALNSCTSALIAGMRALDIGPGDEVIVPGYTFIASIASVLAVGARPVLAEIDESLTLDPVDVASKVTARTRAIMAVHMLGAPADLPRLLEISNSAGIHLIEDSAQALGGSFGVGRLGSWGAFGAFSLNNGKVITAGDGGLLSTSDSGLYARAFAYHDHGFAPDRAGVVDEGSQIGQNLRINEFGSAVALAQLKRLDGILDRCRATKARVVAVTTGVPGSRPRQIHDPGECATVHVVIFDDAARAALAARQMGGRVLSASAKHNYAHMYELHREFRDTDSSGVSAVAHAKPGALPRTDDILGRSVALSIGVVDEYLGTLGNITIEDDDEGVELKLGAIMAALEGR